jgi:acetylornithine aminotransferase
LCALSGLDEAFFCNSGLEANEAAIKLARKYGHARGKKKPSIIVMENAFHGRSLATLSATASKKAQEGFGPLVEGFVRVPLNDLDAIVAAAAANDEIVAVLMEPIQGEGGIHVSQLDYLRGLSQLCSEREWLFLSDEVQSGIGRTGKWFMYQHAGISPDVLTLAKGLGSGVPVGACLTGGRARGVFGPGNHGSTFGGNQLAMRAILTTLEAMTEEKLLESALAVGTHLRERLSQRLAGVPGVVEVRGMGLMLGIQLDRPCREIVKLCLDRGLVVNVTADTVVRLLPSLIMTREEADQVVELLVPTLRAFLT